MPRSARQTAILWILQIIVGLAFVASASAKIVGVPAMVETFAQLGLGQGFRYLTAILELIGAIGLFVPGWTFYASTLLAAIMVSAIAFHRTVIGGSPVPAIVLLLFSMGIAFLSRAGQRA